MKRRGFMQSVIGSVVGFASGKLMADGKPDHKYKTIRPDDDGFIVLAMKFQQSGTAFKMRFKPQGNWDKRENTHVLIDYVVITQLKDFDDFAVIEHIDERNRNGENQATAEKEAD